MNKPFAQSFWIHERLLCAGCYPGHPEPRERDVKLNGLLECGIRQVVSLMQAHERSRGGHAFEPYAPRLLELADERGLRVECRQFPIRDASAPTPDAMRQILDALDEAIARKIPTYFHCWGGHGRTGTVAACHLIRGGLSAEEAIGQLLRWRAELPKNHHPFEGDQELFVRAWGKSST